MLHDQSILFSELRLHARYGVTDALAAELIAPVRAIDMGIVYRDLETGDPVDLANPDIHHRDETLAGLFDPWLVGSYSWQRGQLRLAGKLGTTVPLGRTEDDPFALGDMGLEHQHIQFGSGIFAPIVGVEARYDLPRWSLSGQALTIQSLYESDKAYQPGDRYIIGMSALSKLGTDRWSFRVSSTFQAETAERWGGERRTDEGNQGRTDLLAGLGVTRVVDDRFTIHASVQIPVYNRVVGGQLEYPAIGEVGLTASFDLLGGSTDDHDHDHGGDHDHGDHDHGGDHEVDWRGIDIAHLTQTGEAVPLEPVAGKVTVFDFWAPWCKPCKELDRELAALARKHPGSMAIRKINVVDWDSAAAADYLTPGGFNLPHIKVFGPDGARVLQSSGAPSELVHKVAELLDH